jgi:hypothetical protein
MITETFKKLTGQEIIDILSGDMEVEDFAFEDFKYGSFMFSPDVKEYEVKYNLLYDERSNCKWYKLSYGERKRMEDDCMDEAQVLKGECEDFTKELQKFNPWDKKKDEFFNGTGLGKFEIVDEYGGEGLGEEWWMVFYFKDHDEYIKIDGHYTSYSGTEFYGGWEKCATVVRPHQVTVTKYY